jgi:hypothetical protein
LGRSATGWVLRVELGLGAARDHLVDGEPCGYVSIEDRATDVHVRELVLAPDYRQIGTTDTHFLFEWSPADYWLISSAVLCRTVASFAIVRNSASQVAHPTLDGVAVADRPSSRVSRMSRR